MAQQPFYTGENITCHLLENGIVELIFDHAKASVNKLDAQTLKDLRGAVDAVKSQSNVKGMLISSAKDVFIVGADITEFLGHFEASEEKLNSWLMDTHRLFNDIEDLPFPTVSAINGICLGGGFEVCLTTSYRVASKNARVGLPETKLGLYPGWGGTIRLPRLIGADNAIEWIAGGTTYKPQAGLAVGAVDAVVENEQLKEAACDLIMQACEGKLDWQARNAEKKAPLKIVTPIEASMVFEGAKGFVAAKAGPHYPAPIKAISVMQACAGLTRDQSTEKEVSGFVKMAKSDVAESLVTIYLSDQFNKKKNKKLCSDAIGVKRAGVLGAGIMGGGICYQSASKGVPVLMKDIAPEALELGMNEAGKLLNKQVERKKIKTDQMGKVLSTINPTLSYGDFGSVDLVVEAVVENENIKKSVYKELESHVSEDTIIATNTSTISISKLAEGTKRPENFCGMHFFNPVHRMPLVEVIRGKQTSEKAVATTVAYALQMGKTPIVVNDCPGFLVNRILFPYFFGFAGLVKDGVDFKRIDKVMEGFGWPMGPAYLLDVVGIDTAVHAADVMAEGFPDRMSYEGETAMTVLKGLKRYGQKNGKGFYSYEPDRKGKPKKKSDPEVYSMLNTVIKNKVEVSDQDIIDRMMIPMINESVRCLEDKIVSTAMEVDLGLIYGIGFPPFRGGALKYADRVGLSSLVDRANQFSHLGAAYKPTAMMVEMGKNGQKFYQN